MKLVRKATMYLQYLMERIHITALVHIDFSDLPNLQNLSLSDVIPSLSPRGEPIQQPFEDLSLDLQIQILDRRLLDACIGTEAIWATLNELVGKLTSEISEHPPDSYIAFRVFDDHSQARYFSKGDIRCGNWQEFNVNEHLTRVGAENHIRGARISTNYISISTSPRRLWNFVGKHKSTTQKIVVIDLRVLQRLGIAYGSTTDDLGFRNIGDNRT
ncbi:uncharacterized protein BKA55DRAFT_676723 [Fusarium redolens]|uniref:DUF7587 domain-containing protein n=1 Tax=Fusarium redolens TaxID=48865 RepID=A0A9P9GZ12_FUSRE|nr:uncharacterized protein BKA55DRAFT_676723 [Fusarium redolens]KAH7247254.1 hypothetical protein BKA55DRAFT_676723 [Fusarium redolens]